MSKEECYMKNNCEEILKSNLKKLRLNHPDSPTKQFVANACELSYPAYFNLEKPDYHLNPKLVTLDKLANFYGVSVADLFRADLFTSEMGNEDETFNPL